jgi:hypothetical protein
MSTKVIQSPADGTWTVMRDGHPIASGLDSNEDAWLVADRLDHEPAHPRRSVPSDFANRYRRW